jgi:hypothetical protein
MRRWRKLGTTVFAAQLTALFVAELFSLHTFTFGLQVLLTLVALGLALLVWVHRYQFAELSGGRWYALGQTLLSIALTPVAYIGVAAVPLLVERDVKRGYARWRRETAPPLRERVLWAVMLLIAIAVCTVLLGPIGPLAGVAFTLVTWKLLRFGDRARA